MKDIFSLGPRNLLFIVSVAKCWRADIDPMYVPCRGLPWLLSGKEFACQSRHRFDRWAGKIAWRRKWHPTPVSQFLPGKYHEQRSLVNYYPWGHKRIRHDWVTKQHNVPCRVLANLISGTSDGYDMIVSWRNYEKKLKCKLAIFNA